jgi:hypothetical protein
MSRPATPEGGYQPVAAAFHAGLAAAPPPGFISSARWRVAPVASTPVPSTPVPSAPEGYYVDWYLMADFAALGELNVAAVNGTLKAPHDRVAARSGGGAAGLYQLRAGGAQLVAGWETWFAKPRGWGYADVDRSLEGTLRFAPESSLLRRQLVLCPTTEFCLVTRQPDAAATLRKELNAVSVARTSLSDR